MDNKRLIVAIILSTVVLVAWNYIFPPAVPQKAQVPNATEQVVAKAPITADSIEAEPEPAKDLKPFTATEGTIVTVDTPLYTAKLNSAGGILDSFVLKDYRKTLEGDDFVDLVDNVSRVKAPLGLLVDGRPSWRDAEWAFTGGDMNLAEGQTGSLEFEADIKGMRVLRILTFDGDDYLIKDSVRLLNVDPKQAAATRIGFTVATPRLTAEDDRYNPTKIAYLFADGLNDEADTDDLAETGLLVENGLKWGGVMTNYFIMASAPQTDEAVLKARFEDGVFRAALVKQGLPMVGASEAEYSTTYVIGPKKRSYMDKAPNGLDQAVDYGWFDVIAKPLVQGMDFFYDHTGNYGVAIILLTIIIKILFLPLSHKSYKSMESMKKIQPMMAKLREKYKDDKQRLNQELMSLYKTYKVNPAGGCLPMLVQIPVFIGLYQGLLNAIELRHAPFITHLPFTDIVWLADLSAADPFYITPLLMGLSMFLQQKMMPAAGDPTQQKIMMLMPLIMTFMFLSFPSGLVVYWLVNNILSIAQQSWMLRKK